MKLVILHCACTRGIPKDDLQSVHNSTATACLTEQTTLTSDSDVRTLLRHLEAASVRWIASVTNFEDPVLVYVKTTFVMYNDLQEHSSGFLAITQPTKLDKNRRWWKYVGLQQRKESIISSDPDIIDIASSIL